MNGPSSSLPTRASIFFGTFHPFFFYKQSLLFFLFFFLPQLSSAQLTFRSHCDTCKILGGGAYTMNQIIPKSALKITKGGEPGKYTYYGDSGKVPPIYPSPPYIPPSFSPLSNTFYIGSQLLLLPQMYLSHLPSSRSHGPRNHYCSNGTFARCERKIWGWSGNLWEGEDGLGTEDCGDFWDAAAFVREEKCEVDMLLLIMMGFGLSLSLVSLFLFVGLIFGEVWWGCWCGQGWLVGEYYYDYILWLWLWLLTY